MCTTIRNCVVCRYLDFLAYTYIASGDYVYLFISDIVILSVSVGE